MVNQLIIRHFRGINKGKIKDFKKINLLLGPNNSGKSAILEMLYLSALGGRECSLIISPELPELPELIGNSEPIRAKVPLKEDFFGLEPFSRLRTRHGEPSSLKEPMGWVTKDGVLEYNIGKKSETLSHKPSRFRLVPPLLGEMERNEFRESDLKTISGFAVDSDAIEKYPDLLLQWVEDPDDLKIFINESRFFSENSFSYLWYNEFVTNGKIVSLWGATSLPDISPEFVLLYDFHATHSHFSQKFYDLRMLVQGWTHKIEDSLFRVLPELEGTKVSLGPHKELDQFTGFIEAPDRIAQPIDSYGDGARHSFKILASLTALTAALGEGEHGLFLWEDPELFMHPETLRALLREAMRIIKNKNIQIFITTQSLEVIAYMAEMLEENDVLNDSDFVTFRLNLSDGELMVSRFRKENLISWLRNQEDPRLWGIFRSPLRCSYGDLET